MERQHQSNDRLGGNSGSGYLLQHWREILLRDIELYSNTNTYPNNYSNRNTYRYPNNYSNRNTYTNADSGNTYTKNDPDAEAASDAASVIVIAAHIIRIYDDAGNVIETHEHKGEFKEW